MSERRWARRTRSDAALAGAWGLAEGTLFFVVPDVPIGWIALRRPRQLVAAWLAATGGGVAGAALIHLAVRHGWEPDSLFGALPGTRPGDLERVRDAVAQDVTRAFALGAVSGVPLKVYVAAAARQGVPLWRVLGLTAINRAPRIGLFGLVLAVAGALVPDRWRPSPRTLAIAYGLGWVAFYTWYWALREAPEPSGRQDASLASSRMA